MNIPLADPTVPFGRILHLGAGAFHRAHEAVYLHRLKRQGERGWLLASTNIRPDANPLLDALAVQNGGYTLETVQPNGRTTYEWISGIDQVIPWEADLATATRLAADPLTRIISFTVTLAGYYLSANGGLDLRLTELSADLDRVRQGQTGRTLYGALIGLLRARMQAGSGPITLQSGDSLRHNGDRARKGLREFAHLCGAEDVLAWLDTHTSFPNTIVDRITPRPPSSLRQRVYLATGYHDRVPITAESHLQWVIEDRFIAGRPHWEDVGVHMVDSINPYEEAKARLLKATHCGIAWAGTLRGHTYIHESVHDPLIRQLAFDYITQDAIPCLGFPDNPVDLLAYRDQVLNRLGNVSLQDTNQRVSAHGFSKIPNCIAPTIRERLAGRQSIEAVVMLPALFLAFLKRWHHGELPYDYIDQNMNPALGHAMIDSDDPVAALCAEPLLWGDLAGNTRLTEAVRRGLARVEQEVITPARQVPGMSGVPYTPRHEVSTHDLSPA
ncbi:MAG: mannitol dehydrogenase family protein [Lautropia sp.]|nr:mannitol dehydrogenase family protein [Lautropia sp.]